MTYESNTDTQAEQTPASITRQDRPSLRGEVFQYAVLLIILIMVKGAVVEAYNIPSSSMEDTLLIGDFIVADKVSFGGEIPFTGIRLPAFSDPERGDICIFIYPVDGKTRYIKRCIGIPGDTILIINKQLYVNNDHVDLPEHGKFMSHRVIPRRNNDSRRDNYGPFVVPEGQYFMMGDNRDNSADSRYWGTVPRDLILGRAMLIHWSWDGSKHHSPEVKVQDPLSVPRLFLYNLVHFFEKVRWSRLMTTVS